MSWFKKLEQKIDHKTLSQAPTDGKPTPQNATIFQSFEWHTPGGHWTRLSSILPSLAHIGITSLWLPPGCKANSPQGNGYDCYDLWDLGEFDQKFTRSTKWGSREELTALLSEARQLGVATLWDAVLNHKTAGDATEDCWAVEVDPNDRRQEITRPQKLETWTHYYFPGRGDALSGFKWHSQHFNGTDWDQRQQKHAIFKIVDPPESYPRPGAALRKRPKGWAADVDDENGNADYLMFSNIDYSNEEVRQEVLKWGEWMVRDVGVDGFRLDAVQHYSWNFARQWIDTVQRAGQQQGRDIFVVGEFWTYNLRKLLQWSDKMGPSVKTYDCLLLSNLSKASLSRTKWDYDLRKVFKDTLLSERPDVAVTMVTSHDTQPGQATDTPFSPLFKAPAYALILLRREGLPCVFYGDVYGTQGPKGGPAACWGRLPHLVLARKLYAYGDQADYFDNRTSIGWTRLGTWDRQDGCAIIMSIAGPARKKMYVGNSRAGQVWTDVMDNCGERVTIDGGGYGTFACMEKGVSVYVYESAAGRDQFPPAFDINIYK